MDKKSNFYLKIVTGISLFLSVIFLVLINTISIKSKPFDIDNVYIGNITSQSIDIYWKGYSTDESFVVKYKEESFSGPYKTVHTDMIYPNYISNNYLYIFNIDELNPDSKYLLSISVDDDTLYDGEFTTKPIQSELEAPIPISGESFPGDYIRIWDDTNNFLVKTGYDGTWSFDSNNINEDFEIEIFSSIAILDDNIISKYTDRVFASATANCDEISYSGVPSDIRSRVPSVQNILANIQGGGGGNPQYDRCYQDVYCEADKYGVDGRWTLADWLHESNASDYEFPKGSLYEDFGVHCCGVPSRNFQAQLGFFLNLSHDPCGCNGNCTKDEYYCCWASNYLLGAQTKTCSERVRSYLNSLLFYYNMVGNPVCGSTVSVSTCSLPMPIKTSGRSLECGDQDSIDIYKESIGEGGGSGNGNDDDEDIEDESGGICCALKISGKDNFKGDYESTSSKTCSQIWDGLNVYGGSVEYAIEMNGLSRLSCEKEYTGVCCDNDGTYQWVPNNKCSSSKKVSEYSTYNSCLEAGGERIDTMIDLSKGYNFISWSLRDSESIMASDLLNNASITLVAGFENGIWNEIMYKDGGTKGADFILEPGRAYLITTSDSVSIPISGIKTSTFDWGSKIGWQLVPSFALNPYANTKDIVLSFDTVDISQVALWSEEQGLFNYYIYTVQGDKVGDSVDIGEYQGVFVKID